jgi:hypothetical protein
MPKRRLRGIERRWFVSSTDAPADHAGYLDTVSCLLQPHGTLTARTDTLDGQPVVVLTDAGDQPGTAPGEVTVADATPASPLRVTQTGPRRAGGPRQGKCANGDEVDTTRAADARLTILTTPPRIEAPRHATKLSQGLAMLVVLGLGDF